MRRFRCALYTRKSSEEGLDQSFNSLDAQREACAAYIVSQKGEGWTPIKGSYDDGGYSGGSMDRPGLRRLLEDVAAGTVDVVVVYKVDRLTRSLADFAKMVELFDRHGVSFVSVTQAFNTTTSMGRLTLNVLLSFAQFEREVTGERIRDKIAASKARGMWMGGNLPLGYDTRDRTLVINPEEAEVVRLIFRRYIELGSVHALKADLDEQGIVSKRRVSSAGRTSGGQSFSRGALFHLLQNRIYLGEIVHRGKPYPGLHEAILDVATFDTAQQQLADNRREHSSVRERGRAPLTGLIFDAAGRPMTPTHSRGKSGRRYRYYAVTDLQTGRRAPKEAADAILRLPAAGVEDFVLHRLRLLFGRSAADWTALVGSLHRVEVMEQAVALTVKPPEGVRLDDRLVEGDQTQPGSGDMIRILAPVRLVMRGGRTWFLAPTGSKSVPRSSPDQALINALRRAHQELESHGLHAEQDRERVQDAKAILDPYIRKVVRLAFLAPDIQQAILDGRQPTGLTLQQLLDAEIPLGWCAQRQTLGFPESH